MLATDLGSKRIHVPGNLLVGDAGKDGSLAVGFDSRSLSEEEHPRTLVRGQANMAYVFQLIKLNLRNRQK